VNLLIIRTDATNEIGTGHIMRCLALAQAWQDKGGRAVFISRCESAALRQRITAEGFELISLDKSCPDPFDLDFTISTLNKLKAQNSPSKTWLVVDGYHFDGDYQRSIKAAGYKLLWFDDYGHADHYCADLVLNHSIAADPSLYTNREPSAYLLLGTPYVLLRHEFRRWQGWQREIPPIARKVLVTLGGADPDNVTLKAIQALKQADMPGLEGRIVIGPANPHLELLKKEIGGDSRLQLLTDVADMPDLMAWADVCISAGGTTCFELAFMGLPSIVMVLSDNQSELAEGLGCAGIALNLGWFHQVTAHQITAEVNILLHDGEQRGHMSQLGRQLADHEGCNRILRAMGFSGLVVRPVREEDVDLLWKWANDPDARQSAFQTKSITWKEHRQWFARKRRDPQCYQFIALNDQGVPIGQLRFDISDDEAEVDVSVDKNERRRGYGSLLISLGIKELIQMVQVQIIHAYIKTENHASIKSFQKANFTNQGLEVVRGISAVHLLWRRNA
jgi:UDP-2,4-diacetamido-2,4,6-trideoxy-beta-L-altropyranose hydrolase